MTMTMMMTMVMMLWIVGSVGLGLSSLPAQSRLWLRLCQHCLSPVGTAALLAPRSPGVGANTEGEWEGEWNRYMLGSVDPKQCDSSSSCCAI